MASKSASMALRLGARAAQRTATRAAVLPAKEASMGLRNFTTVPRSIRSLRGKSAISFASPLSQRRFISERPDGRGRVYDFEDVLSILENPSDSRLLIDVREPHEYAANSIPTAINLPITSHPDALLLSPTEFQDEFGFAKPPTGKEMIFFCKAGVRSKAAAGIARQAGYTNVGEYPGSWIDWERNGGPGTTSPPPAGGVGERTGPVGETKFTGGKTSGEEHTADGVVQPPKGGQFGTQ
ncbi:Rhodanese-like domain-containing protein [Boeremia exigua]|uniref:Rhodanese-like domain-containing protein n=1 Tax=Boeremia exigua TaxID=749465 RepID=UPI001E8E7226|nr:Rhodanese-like domain-containing protein [Boeremia exigua]KAH6629391.1 Rhodanese-like domain-containing protein [Boeremia exigua]